MNKQTLAKWAGHARATLVKRSPEILTGIGIAGMVTTTVLAVRATPKALRLMDVAENEKNDDLTKVEIVKTCWKCYAPAVILGATSIACLIGATSVNARRNAALAAAYQISETAFSEYRDKVIETVGEKKDKVIKDKVAEEKIKNNPVTNNEVFITEKGNTRCFDTISSRYFTSDINAIKKVQNDMNQRLLHEGYLSLNEFYDELGLSHAGIGDTIGWNSDNMIDIQFSAQLSEDEEPCIVLDYRVAPKYNFDRFM